MQSADRPRARAGRGTRSRDARDRVDHARLAGSRERRRVGKPISVRRRSRARRGQALVEFAIVLPVFLLILLGILDFGTLLYSRMTVINAARDGARVGITYADTPTVIPAQVTSQVTGSGGGLITSGMVSTTCVPSASSPSPKCGGSSFTNAKPGDSVRVSVTYPYRPFFPLLFGQTINMTSTVQMTLE
jgi:Flp pilus assembly protein TadG